MKFFNTAGSVNQADHYKIDPLMRWDLDEILFLIDQKKYFILHAPRQTGKTSCLLALRDHLNHKGDYYCVYTNVEAAQVARNDVAEGIGAILAGFHMRIENTLQIKLPFSVNEVLDKNNATQALTSYLNELCKFLNKPLVLFIDELDALVGDTLISVLRQLRAGYDTRPAESFRCLLFFVVCVI